MVVLPETQILLEVRLMQIKQLVEMVAGQKYLGNLLAEAAKGGTATYPVGKNAQRFWLRRWRGYGLSDGGNGSGGYARISWNMYWDIALNSGKGDYKYADLGSGGGGASGNTITETVRVK